MTTSHIPAVVAEERPASGWTALSARYLVQCAAHQVDALGQDIALEQTVEVPAALVTSSDIWEQVVGRVERIEPVRGTADAFVIQVAYNADLAGQQLPQLLNLVYGNISLKRGIRLVDLDLPDEFLAKFRGPKFGVAGLRRRIGVHGRPLLATALKPVGSPVNELARMAYEFSLGGGDIVKDDHNLHDPEFGSFRERVLRCQEAVRTANAKTGRQTLYLPNLMLPAERIPAALEFLVREEIPGVLAAPCLLGWDQVRSISENSPLLILAHPTNSGAFFHDPRHGIDPGLMLGQLFRLVGADASIFPNVGGRFSFTADECRGITRQLRRPLGRLAAAWPAPAGGMRLENIPQMAELYDANAIYLIGGALLSHSANLERSTREFLARIEAFFPARYEAPQNGLASACELPPTNGSAAAARAAAQHLAFRPDFTWDGRTPQVYKANGELPFRDVARHELILGSREQTAFDLRYFEIAPGGYSSLERHAHTHTVICVRGAGTLLCGDECLPLTPNDIAYVPPLAVHQLKNETAEPFGFFCIVDHERDKPRAP